MPMNKHIPISALVAVLLIAGAGYVPLKQGAHSLGANTALAAKFDDLSTNGNSSCSGTFADSIDSMPDSAWMKGSCCSPMDPHRYEEQVEGLKKYEDIPEIPSDPYDIDASLAKTLKAYYDR